MNSTQMKKDYAYCEGVIKASSKSFYTAFSQLPKEKAQAVYAIYAFCRLADDTVDSDENLTVKQNNLLTLKEELTAFSQGHTPDHPMWRALRDVFDRYQMDIQPFYDQIEGQERDLIFNGIATVDALQDYSYYVAGSVGLMLLPILAAKQGVTRELNESAIALGIGMQFTNILRDVGEDYRENNRIYLPEDLLQKYQVNLPSVMSEGPNEAFISLWEELAQYSHDYYQKFWHNIEQFDEDCRLPVLAAARLYHAIMDSVRLNHYDCLSKRNFVPNLKMLQLVKEAKQDLKRR